MTREATPLIVTNGDPFSRGRQLGEAASSRVNRTVEAYFGLFQYHADLDRTTVLREAERFVPVIAGYAPHLLDEMRGIAVGAGRDFLEIVAINARTELLHGVSRRGECTSIAVRPQASEDGHVRIGQNWDWYAWLAGTTVLWAIHAPDGLDVLTFAEAGLVGKIGVNAAGLAVCANLLLHDSDFPGPAVPMHLVLRHVLDTATTVGEAVEHIIATPRCTSCNHLLADVHGTVADVEATPAGCAVLEPRDGIITHANHCAGDSLGTGDRGAREYPETLERGERAETLTAARPLGEADVRALLSDHETTLGSICLHANVDLPYEQQEESVASIIMDLTAGTFDIAEGPPCSASYRRISLSEVLRDAPVPV